MNRSPGAPSGAAQRQESEQEPEPEPGSRASGDAGAGERAEYVLPIRWTSDGDLDELTEYLRWLSGRMAVTVVDGSPPPVFARHAERWAGMVRHLPPDPWPGRNGKTAGVVTGVFQARAERVVLADDDVRYDETGLERVLRLLEHAEIVRPQNVFVAARGRGLPWHAREDTARSLLNRAVGSDYPGTFALRRSALLATGGYDGDVLFENLELLRTIEAAGGRQVRADGVYVARRPPSVRHFAGQRVRQAYDDFAQPVRLALELCLLPLVAWAVRRPARLVVLAGAAIALAEVGRRRAGGAAVFGATAALWAPVWMLERAVAVWLAVGWRLRGGVPYAGSRIRRAGTPVRSLRRRRTGGTIGDRS